MAILHSCAILVATLILGGIVSTVVHRQLEKQLDRRIADDLDTLVRHYRKHGTPGLVRALDARRRHDISPDFAHVVFDAAGRQIAGRLRAPPMPRGWSDIAMPGRSIAPEWARVDATDLPNGMRVAVIAAPGMIDENDRILIRIFAIAMLTIAGVGVISAVSFGAYIRRRLSAVTTTARAIMIGDLDRRVPVGRRRDEFDVLSTVLNTMLARNELLVENLRQVSGDLAHDLRTPLTWMRNGIERALRHDHDPQACRAALHATLAQSGEVLDLFNAILRIAEIEAGGLRHAFGPLSLSGLLQDLCESYVSSLNDGHRRLEWRIAPGMTIIGDRQLLAQAVVNLLDNAQAHTPCGTTIGVTLVRTADAIRLEIVDDGPGIAEPDRARVLRRFTRLASARSTSGHGLGLNLVAAIAAAHDARLTLDDARPGLRVSLCFTA